MIYGVAPRVMPRSAVSQGDGIVRAMDNDLLTRARRRFYNLGGPWYRCKIAETVGSQRFSHPALFGMDRLIAELVPHGGTFFEAGAHDGYTQSNTYFLERFCGWHGVLVEPMPETRKKCERRRSGSQVFGCALAGPGHPKTLTMHFGDLMSKVDDPTYAQGGLNVTGRKAYAMPVPARTLSEVLDEAGLESPVDVMVLDLEGHEIEALSGLDFERHAPRFLMLESLDGESKSRARFDPVLDPHFSFREMMSDYDLLYERRS
jgi:FkbM family methyltransferase